MEIQIPIRRQHESTGTKECPQDQHDWHRIAPHLLECRKCGMHEVAMYAR